jgi:hypothetical protein
MDATQIDAGLKNAVAMDTTQRDVDFKELVAMNATQWDAGLMRPYLHVYNSKERVRNHNRETCTPTVGTWYNFSSASLRIIATDIQEKSTSWYEKGINGVGISVEYKNRKYFLHLFFEVILWILIYKCLL